MSLRCTMILGDCLERLPEVGPGSVRFAFLDLPYRQTVNTWDAEISLPKLWEHLARVGIQNTAYVFSAAMRFAADLVASCSKWFRYDLVWEKSNVTGFLNAKKMPLRKHENLLVFYDKLPVYHPQKTAAPKIRTTPIVRGRGPGLSYFHKDRKVNAQQQWRDDGQRMPVSVLKVSNGSRKQIHHPTQKPTGLLDWLVRTYSNAGDLVLDPVSGSGATALAALAAGRNVVCIEKNEAYHSASVERVRRAIAEGGIDAEVEVQR